MKRIFYLSLCLLTCYTLWTCDDIEDLHQELERAAVIADFSPSLREGEMCEYPCTIKFNNHSTNASRYHWDFGDGYTSIEENPEHLYSQIKSYNVTLTAYNEQGESQSKALLIQVVDNISCAAVAGFDVVFEDEDCVAPCAVQFVNQSTNANSFEWDFGDGTTSTELSPIHTYECAGEYRVVLFARQNCEVVADGKVIITANTFQKTFPDLGSCCAQISFYIEDEAKTDVIQTSDGGFLIVGIDIDRYSNLIIKTDIKGEEEWKYTDTTYRAAKAAIETENGDFIVVGADAFSTSSGYVLKIGNGGEFKSIEYLIPDSDFSQSYELSEMFLYDVIQAEDGSFFIIGSKPDGSNLFGDGYSISKIDSECDTIKSHSNSTRGRLHSATLTKDGELIAVGTHTDCSNPFVCGLFIKVDKCLDEVKEKEIEGIIFAWSIASVDDGYVITGWSRRDTKEVRLVKINEEGTTQWSKTYDQGEGKSVAATADGGYIITGYIENEGAGGKDVYLLKTNAEGEEEWHRTFGTPADEVGYTVIQTTDCGFAISTDNSLIKTDQFGKVN